MAAIPLNREEAQELVDACAGAKIADRIPVNFPEAHIVALCQIVRELQGDVANLARTVAEASDAEAQQLD